MMHLVLYYNELDIRWIVIDREEAGSVDATLEVMNCYEKDCRNPEYKFRENGYPLPEIMQSKIYKSNEDGVNGIISEALCEDSPLYIAMWRQMDIVEKSLLIKPEIAGNIRLITIGPDLKLNKFIL